MRFAPARPRLKASLTAVALAVAVLPATAGADEAPIPPLPGHAITTGNVTFHGTIPIDAPGVGGEVVVRDDLDGRTFFYVTGAYGLSIYDVSDPLAPQLSGHLAFPHSQNEDLKVSDDGTRAVLAADGSLPFSPNYVTTGVHIVDTTDVANPMLVGSTSALVRGDGAGTGRSEHTVACADAACEFLYGSSSGDIYDATDPGAIRVVGQWNLDRDGNPVPSRHALNRDESGLLISDSSPRLVLDATGVIDPSATPTTPVVLSQGDRAEQDPRLQHNSIRPDAAQWTPRADDDHVQTVAVQPPARSKSVTDQRPVLRPGELFIGVSESNFNTGCTNGGGLSTWSMANFDRGEPLQQLEVFQPLQGTWIDGNPAANVGGCSAHWFTENDGIVAGAWYEHGVRFFDIDSSVGTIEEVGYFQPVAGIASAAYWIDDTTVYSVDNLRGIDILSFDRDAPRPSAQELTESWLAMIGKVDPAAAADRLLCRLATDN
jgi:hypothetical protein